MTLTGAWKKKICLKRLMAESGYELSLVAGIATGALVKGGSRSEIPAHVEGAAYRSVRSKDFAFEFAHHIPESLDVINSGSLMIHTSGRKIGTTSMTFFPVLHH
ncbi:hypothetical protein Tco_0627023 [Tanacetum coccineum]|uniref:Uncharacterized protein n=1 Tax=Tanacetum coccineum TaxID=301880 RepID=A0ABQ4WLA9_9ASTR